MLSSNDYFDGNVKSIGFTNSEGRATLGVMAPGSYRFDTNQPEEMVVVSGALTVLLPGQQQWQEFKAGSRFNVPGNSAFDLKIAEASAYLCRYL
ncbi:pyrimidine/purine nucleoside phosphorylase [Gallaecimonas mangrovi]|uniref:pyrimidine/purine nucleoside phosphorylase n=1 Tax=Gallaecimonas mangrovi TaxID=2291597 RepID=UPI000E20C619|nr:pyrimidine/purine nucleoside phosphorylase [Gallaecimonas mangrovi]